jgi:hypothetical protein
MHPRVDELVNLLGLAPHPQGGYLRELHRSAEMVAPGDGRGERAALSTMYMLLLDGKPSRMHAVAADEVWQFCEGAPVELLWIAATGSDLRRATLGPAAPGQSPMVTVPGGCWRAARTGGAFTLLSCALAPAFDLRDFRPLGAEPETTAAIRARHPELEALL